MFIGRNLNDEEAAENLMRHKARGFPIFIVMFITVQLIAAKQIVDAGDPEAPHMFIWLFTGLLSWLIMCTIMLFVVGTGGPGGINRPGMRPYINDELTKMHRLRAFSFAFWMTIVTGFALMAYSIAFELSALLAIHTLIGIGVISAAARYTWLERRALKS